MFLCHLDDEIKILFETNRMRIEITVPEKICLYMSVVDLPFRRMYWSRATRQPIVANALSINRFEEILSLLHVNDNQLLKMH